MLNYKVKQNEDRKTHQTESGHNTFLNEIELKIKQAVSAAQEKRLLI